MVMVMNDNDVDVEVVVFCSFFVFVFVVFCCCFKQVIPAQVAAASDSVAAVGRSDPEQEV